MLREPNPESDRTESRIHRLFQVSVILKGLHALIECGSGVALYLVSNQTIVHLAQLLTQEELLEDPRDIVATRLLDIAQHLSLGTQSFYSFYLLSHGLVKVVLVAGLLRERLWAYPASLVALAGFIAYQLYRYSYTHGIGLLVLTVFDVLVIVLVWHEWRVLERNVKARRNSGR